MSGAPRRAARARAAAGTTTTQRAAANDEVPRTEPGGRDVARTELLDERARRLARLAGREREIKPDLANREEGI